MYFIFNSSKHPPARGSPHTETDSDECRRASWYNTVTMSYQLGTATPESQDKVTGSNTVLINNLEPHYSSEM